MSFDGPDALQALEGRVVATHPHGGSRQRRGPSRIKTLAKMGLTALLSGAALVLGLGYYRAVAWDRISFFESAGATPGPMRVFYYRPAQWRPDTGQILVALHGADRDAPAMLAAFRDIADRRNILIVAPEFSDKKFPGVSWYNLANTVRAGSAQAGRSGWAFEALYHAVDEVRAATQAKAETFTLFGFSAGAQFALRLQFLLGAPQIDRLIASSAGWYTLPSAEYDWPCGLGGMPVAEERLAATVARKLTVVVGLDDTKVRDDFGDRGYEACSARQGRNRLERAEAFMQAGLPQAQRLSVANGWRLVKVAGAGHSVEDLLRLSSDEILAQTWR